MASVETLQAMLERRLIRQLVRSLASGTSPQQREQYLFALRDMVQQADPTLDPRLFDEWTEGQLRRCDLWVWEQSPATWQAPASHTRRTTDG